MLAPPVKEMVNKRSVFGKRMPSFIPNFPDELLVAAWQVSFSPVMQEFPVILDRSTAEVREVLVVDHASGEADQERNIDDSRETRVDAAQKPVGLVVPEPARLESSHAGTIRGMRRRIA